MFKFVMTKPKLREPSGGRSKTRFEEPIEPFMAANNEPARGAQPVEIAKAHWRQNGRLDR